MKEFSLRVYYEDTDAQGVVYYANYLKFFERARTEYLRESNYDQMKLMQERIIFVVRSVEMRLIKPARLDDTVVIKSKLLKLGKVSFDFLQEAYVENNLITQAKIQCGSLNSVTFKPSPLPEYLHTGMKKLL
jgi:acyl-CoA thioester hydrolase